VPFKRPYGENLISEKEARAIVLPINSGNCND